MSPWGDRTPRTSIGWHIYIPNSIKVALGIGQLDIGKLLFVVTQAKHCIVFRMPKCPMSNCQWPIAKATFIELGICASSKGTFKTVLSYGSCSKHSVVAMAFKSYPVVHVLFLWKLQILCGSVHSVLCLEPVDKTVTNVWRLKLRSTFLRCLLITLYKMIKLLSL